MSEIGEGRLRLTILGGFLGAGKTTWLRHQLHEGGFGKAHVIVNEAADAPVDDGLLARASRLTVLAGACVCCDGQEALSKVLLGICDERSRDADDATRLQEIVLETSGLADPGAIMAAVQAHPVLARQIVVHEIAVIVDAVHGLEQLRLEPLCRAQIEAADRHILTKTDQADVRPTAVLAATLRALAPEAVQSATLFGSTTVMPSDVDARPEALPALVGAENPIVPARMDLAGEPDWTGFTIWLSALLHARGDQIVRVKGVVRTPAGRLLVQTVRKCVQAPEVLPDPDTPCATDNSIAVIGRGFDPNALEASLQRFLI